MKNKTKAQKKGHKVKRKTKSAGTNVNRKRKKDILMEVNVQKTIYMITIPVDTSEMDKINADGFCDDIAKEIQIRNLYDREDMKRKDALIEMKHNLRHELIHAFIKECGLAQNDSAEVAWPVNEACVDFYALQHDKLSELFRESYEIFKYLD